MQQNQFNKLIIFKFATIHPNNNLDMYTFLFLFNQSLDNLFLQADIAT